MWACLQAVAFFSLCFIGLPPPSLSHSLSLSLSHFSNSKKSKSKETDARKHMQRCAVSAGCEEELSSRLKLSSLFVLVPTCNNPHVLMPGKLSKVIQKVRPKSSEVQTEFNIGALGGGYMTSKGRKDQRCSFFWGGGCKEPSLTGLIHKEIITLEA